MGHTTMQHIYIYEVSTPLDMVFILHDSRGLCETFLQDSEAL